MGSEYRILKKDGYDTFKVQRLYKGWFRDKWEDCHGFDGLCSFPITFKSREEAQAMIAEWRERHDREKAGWIHV